MDDTAYFAGEQLLLVNDRSVGLRAALAVNSTVLGPGLGGVRMASYPSELAGIVEAQRLAAGMTLKNALAGLPYGGAKSVIFAGGPIPDRETFMTRFGEAVTRLGGSYVPGVDMGTTTQDLTAIAAGGARVSCSDEDPSPWTAAGVHSAMRSAVRRVLGRNDLEGVRVLIQGTGHVGARLAATLAAEGARLSICDIDGDRATALAEQFGGAVVAPDSWLEVDSDVFAPCATAKVIDGASAARIRTRVIVGAANDTLASDGNADVLARRGIVYVPDFIANAGGVIQIHALNQGWSDAALADAISEIGTRVDQVLEEAVAQGVTPLLAATARAEEILSRARDTATAR
jgi:leucine dehydrogenase